MKFGLTETQYQYVLNTVVFPLTKKGATIWCFGSRARGDFNKYSDLDLMVESDTDLSRDISKILEVLQNSNFPLLVDLVLLSDFADAYKPSYIRDRKPFLD